MKASDRDKEHNMVMVANSNTMGAVTAAMVAIGAHGALCSLNISWWIQWVQLHYSQRVQKLSISSADDNRDAEDVLVLYFLVNNCQSEMSYRINAIHIVLQNYVSSPYILYFCHVPSNVLFYSHSISALALAPIRARSRSYPRSLSLLSALALAPIRARSRSYPRSLSLLSALTPAHSSWLQHVLMHEYWRENDEGPSNYL